MTLAVALVLISVAFAIPASALIMLVWLVASWTGPTEPPPAGGAGPPGGSDRRPRPLRPHGGPDRRPGRRRTRPRRRRTAA